MRFLPASSAIVFLSLFTSASVAMPQAPAPAKTKFTDGIMNPHAPPAKGPWFEGWYVRLSDADGSRSVAVIVASTLASASPRRTMSGVPGYVAILTSDGNGRPTISYEAFPAQTEILFAGRPIDSSTTISEGVNFEWRAPGFGSLTERAIHIEIPGRLRIDADVVGERKPWSSMPTDFGPQGLAALFSFLPLHWYVHTRATLTDYTLTRLDGGEPRIVEGRAWAHVEKNFGQAFPSVWMWMQATSPDGQAHVALAGGRLEMGLAQMTTYMIGYKSPRVEASFRPSEIETNFYQYIDPCSGRFTMRALNLEHELLIEAVADPQSFGSISIPTREGYVKNGGRESFSSRVTVEVLRNDWAGQLLANRLIERRVFENGALEFGAAYQDCKAKSRFKIAKPVSAPAESVSLDNRLNDDASMPYLPQYPFQYPPQYSPPDYSEDAALGPLAQ